MENMAFHSLNTRMKDDYTTNSHFEFGSENINEWASVP